MLRNRYVCTTTQYKFAVLTQQFARNKVILQRSLTISHRHVLTTKFIESQCIFLILYFIAFKKHS